MRIRLLYLGMLKELAGTPAEDIEVPDGSTAADLWSHVAERFPKMKGYERSIAISVNQEFAARSTVLRDGDEVGLLPPVSGGVEAALESEHCRIQRERIDSEAILQAIKHPEDGAVTLFDGIVRNNTRGR